MLLVIDVGNTNTVIGIYENDHLIKDWRIRTERNITEDELQIIISSLIALNGFNEKLIAQTIISCVVPPMVSVLDSFCKKYLGHAPLWVNAKTYTKMPICYPNPNEVGADRIVNAVGAYHKYPSALIVIDFGTATTFDVISEKGEYLGGAISPGVMVSAEALFKSASKLPRVEIFHPPQTVIGKDTATGITSGIIYGYAGLVDGIVKRMKKEMTCPVKVIATGGLAHLIASVAESIEKVEPNLTLEGLRIIAKEIKD